MGISKMQIYAYIARVCRACQQQWKLSKVGVVFYWNNILIYIYIFVQMFFLDKTHPNLIMGIDALDRLHQIQAYTLEFSINFVKRSSLFKPRERKNK